MALDISFDKIAQAYGAQRAHPPEVSAQIGAALAQLAGPGALVLELGVGTGRIALPALAAGCRVVGVDISREMLRVAHTAAQAQASQADTETRDTRHETRDMSTLPGGWQLPTANWLHLIQSDIGALPLRDTAFDAVLAVHVLHLVPDWRAALAEALRVLRPGGLFIQGRDWRDPQSCAERLRGKLREAVMELLPGARPPGAGAAIGQALAKLGATAEPEVLAAEWIGRASPAQVLAGMAARADAETWVLDDALLAAAVGRVRTWASTTWTDLDVEQDIAQRFVLTPLRNGSVQHYID